MSAFAIRRYRPPDRDAVESVMESALRDADAYVEDAPALVDDDIVAEYIDVGGDFLVGVLEGDVVATGAFRPPADRLKSLLDTDDLTAELKRMHVHPEYHRRGYASTMLDELESRASERGFRTLVLETTERQTAAAAFYRTHGFERVASEPVELPDASFDLHYYRKGL